MTAGPVAADPLSFLERQATRRAVLAAGVLGVATLLPVAEVDSGPVVCPVRHLTGVLCPGCGLTRSVTRTMHGQFRQAARLHPGGPVVVALFVGWSVTGRAHAGTWLDPGAWFASRRRRAVLAAGVALWLAWAGVRAFD